MKAVSASNIPMLSDIIRKCCGSTASTSSSAATSAASTVLISLQLWINEVEISFSAGLENLRKNDRLKNRSQSSRRRRGGSQQALQRQSSSALDSATISLKCIIPYLTYYFEFRSIMASQIKEAATMFVNEVHDYFNMISERLMNEQDRRLRLWLCDEIDNQFLNHWTARALGSPKKRGTTTTSAFSVNEDRFFASSSCNHFREAKGVGYDSAVGVKGLGLSDSVELLDEVEMNGAAYHKNILRLALFFVEDLSYWIFGRVNKLLLLSPSSCVSTKEDKLLQQTDDDSFFLLLLNRTIAAIDSLVALSPPPQSPSDRVDNNLPFCTTTINYINSLVVNGLFGAATEGRRSAIEGAAPHYHNNSESFDLFLYDLLWSYTSRDENATMKRQPFTTDLQMLDVLWRFLSTDISKSSLIKLISNVIGTVTERLTNEENGDCRYNTEEGNNNSDSNEKGLPECDTTTMPVGIMPLMSFKALHLIAIFGVFLASFINEEDVKCDSGFKSDLGSSDGQANDGNHPTTRDDESVGQSSFRFSQSTKKQNDANNSEYQPIMTAIEDGFKFLTEKYLQSCNRYLKIWITTTDLVLEKETTTEIRKSTEASSFLHTGGADKCGSLVHLGFIVDLCECLITSGRWDILQERLNSIIRNLFIDPLNENNNEVAEKLLPHCYSENEREKTTTKCRSPFLHQLFKIQQLLRLFEALVGFPIFELDIRSIRSNHRESLKQLMLCSSSSTSILDCLEVVENLIVSHLHKETELLQLMLARQLNYQMNGSAAAAAAKQNEIDNEVNGEGKGQLRQQPASRNVGINSSRGQTKIVRRQSSRGQSSSSDRHSIVNYQRRRQQQCPVVGTTFTSLSVWSVLSRRLFSYLNRSIIEECITSGANAQSGGRSRWQKCRCSSTSAADQNKKTNNSFLDQNNDVGANKDVVPSMCDLGRMSLYTASLFERLNRKKTFVSSPSFSEAAAEATALSPTVWERQLKRLACCQPKRQKLLQKLLGKHMSEIPLAIVSSIPSALFTSMLQQIALAADPTTWWLATTTKDTIDDASNNDTAAIPPSSLPALQFFATSNCQNNSYTAAVDKHFLQPAAIFTLNKRLPPSISCLQLDHSNKSRPHCLCVKRATLWMLQLYDGIDNFFKACHDAVAQQLLLFFTQPFASPGQRDDNFQTKRLFRLLSNLDRRVSRQTSSSSSIDGSSFNFTQKMDKTAAGAAPTWDWSLTKAQRLRIQTLRVNMAGMLNDGNVSMKFRNSLPEKRKRKRSSSAVRKDEESGCCDTVNHHNSENQCVIILDGNNNNSTFSATSAHKKDSNIDSNKALPKSSSESSLEWKTLKKDNNYWNGAASWYADNEECDNSSSKSNGTTCCSSTEVQGDWNIQSRNDNSSAINCFSSILFISEQFWPAWLFEDQQTRSRKRSKKDHPLKRDDPLNDDVEHQLMTEQDIVKMLPEDLRNPLLKIIKEYENQNPGKTIVFLPATLRFEISIKTGLEGQQNIRSGAGGGDGDSKTGSAKPFLVTLQEFIILKVFMNSKMLCNDDDFLTLLRKKWPTRVLNFPSNEQILECRERLTPIIELYNNSH